MSANKPVVLQLIKGLDIGGINGGAERFSVDLSQQLMGLGYEVILCAFFKTGTELERHWLEKIQSAGIQVFFAAPWQGNARYGNYHKGIKILSSFLADHPVDILHSHFQLGTMAAIHSKRKHHVPVALRTAHNVSEWERNLSGRIKNQVFSKFYYPLHLDAEVGVSQAVVDQMSGYVGNKITGKKPHLIYNGFPVSLNIPRSDELPGNSDQFTIGCVGRLSTQKGVVYLIRAMPAVLAACPGARLLLIGDGELRPELEAETALLNLSDRIVFTGQIANVPEYLSRLDLFVSSSLWEGLPTAILEAIDAHVPVVATDIPGTREIISRDENGWLVPPGDPNALANLIIEAIQSPGKRKRFSDNAAKSIMKFSIEGIAQEYDRLYQSLLKEKSSSRQPRKNRDA
ncbi:MAG: glycosyltransferase family 4 protein [Anaerolineaceae bacterium]